MDICYECQELMVQKQGDITLTKTGYGPYEVEGVIHLACDSCGAKVVLPNETKRIESIGLRLHILKALADQGPMSALDLKEEVRSPVELLEEVALILEKEKLIKVDYTNKEVPVISLTQQDLPEPTWWDKILNLFK